MGAKYAGASVDELKRLKELEAENAKHKRMYTDLALENAAIKDVLSRQPRPGAARDVSARGQTRPHSLLSLCLPDVEGYETITIIETGP